MTIKHETETRLTELQGLLDAWGGSPLRWPPQVRLRIAEISAAVPTAEAMLAEARALDALLDRTEAVPARPSRAGATALADRIMAAAGAGTAAPARSAQVIAMPQRKPVAVPVRSRSPWHAAGLMAASLLVGLYIGGSINLGPVMEELADAVGLSSIVDASGEELSDEDAL